MNNTEPQTLDASYAGEEDQALQEESNLDENGEEMVCLSEEEIAEAKQMKEEENQAILASLASEIESMFRERDGDLSTKRQEWIESMRLYLGSLSSDRQLKSSDNPSYNQQVTQKPRHNLVRSKCAVAISKSVSSSFSGGDKNWNISPTPAPEGDEYLMTVASNAMEKEIEDQLEEENYGYKSRLAMEDRVILGTGILKGPLPARDSKLGYVMEQGPDGIPVAIPEYKVRDRPIISRVNPWMFFPDTTVNDIRDGTATIELHPMSNLQVRKLQNNPGFFPEAVTSLLSNTPVGYANATLSEYSSLTNSGSQFLKDKYAVLEYHGPITVDQLGALGIKPSYDPLGDVYFGEVWVCQGIVLRVELEAITGLYESPYSMCAWEKDPNSPFGFGLPQIIKDPQRIAQVTLDMMLENASNSSGPIGVLNKEYIAPTDGDWTIRPNKLFLNTDYTLQNIDQAIKFFNVPNMTEQMFPILNFAREVAQEESTVPMMSLQSSRVGSDSATGMAIQERNDDIVSDFKNEEWDDQIVEPLISRFYHWNMQYNAKPEIKGDFDVDVKSSSEYRNQQLAIRDLEKLSVESAQNPELAKVIDQKALQTARLSNMHIPSKGIIKSAQQMQMDEEQAAQNPPPPDPAMMKIQVEMGRLEVDKEKIALEREKMNFEMQFQQQREEMNHAERMGANYMRELEVQARVQEAMAEREVEMLKLAQKSDSDRSWIMAELQKSQLQADTQKFQAGLDSQSEFRKQALTAAELKYAMKTGKGI